MDLGVIWEQFLFSLSDESGGGWLGSQLLWVILFSTSRISKSDDVSKKNMNMEQGISAFPYQSI